jgi:hypothetical protein
LIPLILFYILVVLNMIDATLTAMIVTNSGYAAELNPVMRTVLESFGIVGMYGFKLITLLILGIALWLQNNPRSANRILIALNVGFLFVIGWTSHWFG